MRFTQLAKITPGDGDDWFNPVLTEDTPLYVDPFLVFEDQSPLLADAHGPWADQLAAAFTRLAELPRPAT